MLELLDFGLEVALIACVLIPAGANRAGADDGRPRESALRLRAASTELGRRGTER